MLCDLHAKLHYGSSPVGWWLRLEEVVRVDVLKPAVVVDCCVWGVRPHAVSLWEETSRLHEMTEVGFEVARRVAESKISILAAPRETCADPLMEGGADLLMSL